MQNENVVFIVDDDGVETGLYTSLEKAGYEVAEAPHSELALKFLQERTERGLPNPVCFLVDLRLRWDDEGFALCEKLLRGDGAKPNPFEDIPIIILTSHRVENDYVRRGIELGAWDYLRKPFDPDILTLKVTRAVEYAERLREGRRQCSDAVVVTDNKGGICWMSLPAGSLLHPFFSAELVKHNFLPPQIHNALQGFISTGRFGSIIVDGKARRLMVRVERHQARPDRFKVLLRLIPSPQTLEAEITAFGKRLQERCKCSLTPRQIQVAYWFAEGRTRAQIGQILNIRSHTVKDHVDNVYAAIGEYMDTDRTSLTKILCEVRHASEGTENRDGCE